MSLVQAHILISGHVQGVGYRAHTAQEARKRGLTGWVRNLPTGQVEALFQGERTSIDDMIAWCRRGPALSQVTEIDVQWEALPDNHDAKRNDFQISL